MSPPAPHPRLLAPLAACLLALALTGCATSTHPPTVDPATAARYSAELTAAQVDHDTTLRDAEAMRIAGTLSGARLEMVRTAGRELDSALLRFHAELQLYLQSGVETDAFNRAHSAMTSARTNLALTFEAVKR